MSELVTVQAVQAAQKVINASPHVRRTALVSGFPVPGEHQAAEIYMKLENTQ